MQLFISLHIVTYKRALLRFSQFADCIQAPDAQLQLQLLAVPHQRHLRVKYVIRDQTSMPFTD
jgi:hypothetical protein